MEEEGVKFVLNTNVGKDITAEELLKKYDRVILACGASNPRDIKVPGREAKGIYFAVDFLGKVTKTLFWIPILKKRHMNLQKINMYWSSVVVIPVMTVLEQVSVLEQNLLHSLR